MGAPVSLLASVNYVGQTTMIVGIRAIAENVKLGLVSWDLQSGVPVTGDYTLHLNTTYPIKLNCTVTIQEWKKDIRIMPEEGTFFDDRNVNYIDGRQTELILLPKPLPDVK